MPDEIKQSNFSGFAVVEIYGHQKYAGHVSTELFGTAVMFRIDIPALEERERWTERNEYHNEFGYLKPGTKVKEGAVQGYTKLFGPGAIFSLTPCTEEACIKAVEAMQPRPFMVVELPKLPALEAGSVISRNGEDPFGFDEDAQETT